MTFSEKMFRTKVIGYYPSWGDLGLKGNATEYSKKSKKFF